MSNNQNKMADPFGQFLGTAAGSQGGEGGSAMNDMAANMVKEYAFGKVRDQYEQNKGYFSFLSVEGLKIYFDVTNYYVLHKLKIILFPFLLKEDDWKRG